jgi:hypothetical protein
MTNLNFIAGIVIVALVAIIIAIRVYQNKDNIGSIDDFVKLYGDQIVKALQSAILVLKVDMKNYETRTEYENVLISTTIDELKKNSVEFGIPENIVDLFDTTSLTTCVINILNNNRIDAFSVLDAQDAIDNEEILTTAVVENLTSRFNSPEV